MTDAFNGVDPEILRDMTKMGVKNLTTLRIQFAGHDDITSILDDQVELLIHNVNLSQQTENLKFMVRAGALTREQAAVQQGAFSAICLRNNQEILLNGQIIRALIHAKKTGVIAEA